MKNILNKVCAIAITLLISSTSVKSQLKYTSSGNFGIGTTNPLLKFHFVGNFAGFTSQTTGAPQSAAVIRGNQFYSNQNNPEYTWWGDGGTGIFHSQFSRMSFAAGAFEIQRIEDVWKPFQVSIFGNAYIQGVWTASDNRFKKNIQPLETSLNKILSLRGVSYEYNKDEFKSLNFSEGRTMGFIAQELMEVLPELVKTGEDGYYSVNYTGVIPYLVEAIKEQQKQIEDLKQDKGNNQLVGKSSAQMPSGNISNFTDNAILYQNIPNPFNIETSIKFFIPVSVKTANIYIYDMNGNKKGSYEIQDRKEASIKIGANELGKGIYFYSLVVDGRIIDSKSMLITD